MQYRQGKATWSNWNALSCFGDLKGATIDSLALSVYKVTCRLVIVRSDLNWSYWSWLTSHLPSWLARRLPSASDRGKSVEHWLRFQRNTVKFVKSFVRSQSIQSCLEKTCFCCKTFPWHGQIAGKDADDFNEVWNDCDRQNCRHYWVRPLRRVSKCRWGRFSFRQRGLGWSTAER